MYHSNLNEFHLEMIKLMLKKFGNKFYQKINFDKVLTLSYLKILDALEGWKSGYFLEEAALLNRIFENFDSLENCDVGINSNITIESFPIPLHRQDKGKDAFGSDLAVTVYFEKINLLKTAFFQFKTSEDSKVQLKKSQLKDMLSYEWMKKLGFVVAIDKNKLDTKIKNCLDLRSQVDNTKKTKQFTTTKWFNYSEWLYMWLSSSTGESSDIDDSEDPEFQLAEYVRPTNLPAFIKSKINSRGGSDNNIDGRMKEEPIPVRGWLIIHFKSEE